MTKITIDLRRVPTWLIEQAFNEGMKQYEQKALEDARAKMRKPVKAELKRRGIKVRAKK